MPSLSVIIPTHRRHEILEKCIEHLAKQTIAQELDVIVVSDGRDPKLKETFASRQWPLPMRYYEIEKSQQGAARNRGIGKALADICLFIGDDAFLEPDACEKHVKAHEKDRGLGTEDRGDNTLRPSSPVLRPMAVLGFTTWDPQLEITAAMRWLEESGWQFGYPMIEKYAHKFLPANIQHTFCYTIHISIPTAIAKAHPFDKSMRMYGWEDIEWGYRLRKSGVPVYYEPDARAYHYHHLTLDQSLIRMEILGQSATVVNDLLPQLHIVPRGFKFLAYQLLSLLPTMSGKHRRAFLRGLQWQTRK